MTNSDQSTARRVTRLAPSPTGALHLGNARTFLITWAIARQRGWKIYLRIEDLDTPRVKADSARQIIETLKWLGMDWDAWEPEAVKNCPPLPESGVSVRPQQQPEAVRSCPPPTPSHGEGASSGRSGASHVDTALAREGGVLVQTNDLEPYREAMRRLCAPSDGAPACAYPCSLSRTEIEAAASAPQEGSHETPFPAALRPAGYDQRREFKGVMHAVRESACVGTDEEGDGESTGETPVPPSGRGQSESGSNWRCVVPDGVVRFDDEVAGPQSHEPARAIGDFVLWTKRDQPSYQLAVVMDDHRQGVTDVIRGDDLLDSAARQLLLYRALGLRPEPRYWHLPLVIGTDGRRLAKRHGDTRIDHYRAMGVPAEGVIGLIARWSGIRSSAQPVGGQPAAGQPMPMKAEEFLARFDLATMPRQPVIFTDEDDRWLRAQRSG